MLEVGYQQKLKAYNRANHGMFLSDEEGNEILLPAKFCPEDIKVGDEIEVFIYLDSQERKVATTQKPNLDLYGFGFLTCTGTTSFGAFMDWGLDRDLLVPLREQAYPILAGERHLTYLFLDDEDRVTGTTNIAQCTEHEDIDLKVGQEVDLLIHKSTPLGVNVIINNLYGGIIYNDDIYAPLHPEDKIKGYIKRIRADKLIDVSIRKFGYTKVKDQIDPILEYLNVKGGHSPLNDKSEPAIIKSELKMSKKVFKKAIGRLYKNGLIVINKDGIQLKK